MSGEDERMYLEARALQMENALLAEEAAVAHERSAAAIALATRMRVLRAAGASTVLESLRASSQPAIETPTTSPMFTASVPAGDETSPPELLDLVNDFAPKT